MCSEGAEIEKKLDRKMKGRTDKPKVDPNIDGGWAWMVVLSSFLVHLLVMGSQMALGILNMEWLEEFNQSRGLTAWVSSLTMGITLIVGPFIGLFINTCGCRKTAIIGGFLTSLGWVLSAFATNVHFLFFTFGVTAGIGSGMVYLPAVVMVGQYFQKHRALAQGLGTTGTGFGTFLITVLLKYLCAEFGWRNAMIIQGAVTLNLCVCGALMRPLESRVQCSVETTSDHQGKKEASLLDAVKPNDEDGECRTDTAASWGKEDTNHEMVIKKTSRLGILKSLTRITVSIKSGFWTWYSSYFGAASLFTNKVFVAFVLWALLAYCSFVIPFIHLPEIVELYGMSEQNNIFPLTSVIAIVHIFGKIILGFLGDLSCVSAWNLFIASNFTFGICILILPLMQIYAALAVVCALIGFSSGYFSLMPVVTEDLVGIKQLANAYGIIICANGISALLGPPFAGWIFDITQKYDYSFYVCGLLYMLGIICLLLEPCLQPKEKNREKPVENREV
ncbi:monocarboxylate transporter 14 isoform X1 [Bufo gargarizans]|uniref:monocarboxylate transporter 14 isoform X1 n=1 Tax=Bufo gargarizans TaxID=30331 RepID=UPI001CF227FC|nr:monocarboxylate transporter 14 isoform X1 [Bufo gargarizans]XP_044148360.1 monocarboxylate transporter 14 isoform X1 [Bufo gargarizans]XP_044148361.1 monocarboxylate transporter 14 isoform X1 [Bufo gargarizans]XP_044148362.1 monocarboxylate transporter 14 isoform X1 [Bufo gargarizans]XP_044148363.1 monocarboxylate transporter 14 isoform X1 [Bufo gargarizans]XP_044148364.1 monocarboxylate transporter 14 isoform X1 [Bufo gargarizans]